MKNRKLIGLLSFFTAIGMMLVLLIASRLTVLVLILFLLFLGYYLYRC